MNPIVAVSIEKMRLYFDAATFLPYRRYILQIVLEGRRTCPIQRFKNRQSALAEKSQLAGYRGMRPRVVDTKTGLEVPDEETTPSGQMSGECGSQQQGLFLPGLQ
ncbi:hypothetical protein DSCW_08520 [Desulfosarcina widdelii]|uniref:Uncharacterized protein n=1 Tax=Desulfosarcina widdelii TaxID=947919 RepID=A0A5K7YYD8_9BACT|nr:hypothetical protein [Desulfosarcina widdelii]BBO73435.1 hypothetical protein DSCW_08520 [Desulfosarcina widdelii]